MSNDDLAMPDGLGQFGRKAYDIIMDHLKNNGLDDTGGCKVFYSPEEWEERGEEYGTSGVLIVVYDGAGARHTFNMDYAAGNRYVAYEELQAKLRAAGMYFQECTGWCSAVYKAR